MLPARPSLPHEDATVASWSRSRCRIALRHFAGRGRPEHHPVRHLPPPPFQATLQRSQLPVPVGAGLLHLQPLKQLARRTPRLGLEPAVQLLRHCCKRVRTPSQPFGLLFRSCRRPHLALLPRGPQTGEELLKRWLLDRGHHLRRIGDLDKPLLHCPNVTEQAHRIELAALQLGVLPLPTPSGRPSTADMAWLAGDSACTPSRPRASSPRA